MKTSNKRAGVCSGHTGYLSSLLKVVLVLAAWFLANGCPFSTTASGADSVTFVVMDPLAKELACACVKGFGQRDYRKLAAELQKAIKQPIKIEFSDDLADSLAGASATQEVIVIGDQSLVLSGATKARLKCRPICELTDSEGNTTLRALFIARADDPAKELKEISGRKLLLGVPPDDAKYAAGMSALRAAGVEVAVKPEQRNSYSDAALDMLDSALTPAPVAFIPGFGLPLLEGCGSVKPGSLRVIGKTEPIPFIMLFLSDSISTEKEQKLLKVLLSIKGNSKMLRAMESRDGFKAVKKTAGEKNAASNSNWPDWRGVGRNGHVPQLPAQLPSIPKLVWKKGAMNGGLAGLSVSNQRLILAERDFADENDVYRCLDASDGELIWLAQFPARGALDYGQFPRATPVIHGGKVYLLGAFGQLRCVNLRDGKLIWERHLLKDFKAPVPTWGMCSTPLIVDNKIIVNPGATNASIVALDHANGRVSWKTAGAPSAYSAFICAELGGRRQIVGYDRDSLGGWDINTGTRLWRISPAMEGDFNVPTPIAVHGGIIVATENNGTRLHHFDPGGRIIGTPAAEFRDLSPTTASPVVTQGRLFGTSPGLYCLDISNGLRSVWHLDEKGVDEHASLIADNEGRVLVITLGGELILLDGKSDTCNILSRARIFEDDVEVYAHPALVGTRLYARGGSSVLCVDLSTN
jgi:outer membrane protein assembly factor BamB/ABC-type phosphate/phosphonate transport system substrate-binding protein